MDNSEDQILYIDDEVENLRGFQFLFKKYYKIFTATSASEGFLILEKNKIKLIIADQRMPKMSGVDFFEAAAKLYPDVIRIILTGYSDIEAIVKAINKGKIFKYVTKPWDKDEFKLIIDNALWSYNIAAENRNLIKSLKEANAKLEEANQNLEKKVIERTEEIRNQSKEIEKQRDQIAIQNEELLKHRTKLELMVHERTIDLVKSKEKAEQSDKLKSAFLANFSHEIRTPMNAIMGFSQLLAFDDRTVEEKKEFIELILVNSQHLLNLINEILDISRIEAGETILEYHLCDLKALLNDLQINYEEQKNILKKSHISIRINPECELNDIKITVDANKLKQILINLIENALKFTDQGEIEFGFKPIENKESNSILFFVKDTGIGIDEDAKDFIFDRFRKVENSALGTLYRGAGLGLAISKKLVEIMGGKIWVESEINSGSTFYFTLPYYDNDEVIEKSIDKEFKKKNIDFNWNNKLILVAEDEQTNFRFIEKVLKRTQTNLLWAKNGLETFEMVQQYKNIDLVLLDIRMPVMDGFEAAKKIKAVNKDIPIIAQTAYALDYEKKEILNAGCNDYISKPYTIHELLTTINKYF